MKFGARLVTSLLIVCLVAIAVAAGLSLAATSYFLNTCAQNQRSARAVGIAALVAAAAGAALAVFIWVSYIRDLSRRVTVLADALQRAEDVHRNLVTDLAHEIRTPLAILRSNLEAMLAGAVEPSVDTISSLHEEVLRMSGLVADLQDLTLSEAGRLSLSPRPVDLAESLGRAARVVAGQAGEKSLTVSVDALPSQAVAFADPDRLMQVITNLLSNALRYTSPGGRIMLSARNAGSMIETCVTNTGEIAGEDLPLLFERFYRGDASRSRTSGGTGLGLAVAKALVEAMGGAIHAESGGGLTTFRFTLPAFAGDTRCEAKELLGS